MKQSLAGKIIAIVILYVSLIMLPLYFMSIVDWRDDANRVQVVARNFVDKAIDSGQITQGMLEDINLSLSGCTGSYHYEIRRETKVTNPVYEGANVVGYETTWEACEWEVGKPLLTGDIITVRIEQNGFSLMQRLSMGLCGVSWHRLDCSIPGMVR